MDTDLLIWAAIVAVFVWSVWWWHPDRTQLRRRRRRERSRWRNTKPPS